MKLPMLNELPTSRDLVDAFAGYNHNLRIGNGEFYDMKNLTSSYYPVLSPRPKRGTYVRRDADGNETVVENVQGLIAKDALCYVANGKFYINDYAIEDSKMALGVSCATCPNAGSCTKYNADNHRTTFCEKTLISMGAFVVIMPDKKYINTAELTDYGSLEASVTTQGTVKFELCKIDGADFGETVKSATVTGDFFGTAPISELEARFAGKSLSALREELSALAEKVDVSESVLFLGRKDNACDYMRACDLYVSASSIEGMPFNLIEAMGCACSVLASRVKGHADLIEDGVSGLLYRFDDLDGFTERVLKFYRGELPLDREKIALAYANFAKENVFDETLEIIKESLKVNK
jgi:hypothetical protein